MADFPVQMPMRPALWRSGDKLYAIGGVLPVQVPADTTMATLGQYAIHVPGVRDSTGEAIEVKDRWIVEGSKGNRYTVTKIGDAFKCSCPGFSFRRKCKHSEKISKEVN
jgi:hypothetical protein|tara:strand:+ start:680 stop:1006 length:327 start_codon:yes stop_codon:yes gene_type:complete